MALSHFLSASILVLGAIAAELCDYGYFSEINETCKFKCDWDGNYDDIDSLSFETIMDACDDVKLANELDPTSCNSLDDLLWMNDTCSCPFCQCSSVGAVATEKLSYDTDGPSKSCVQCECQIAPWYYDGIVGEMFYTCSTLKSVQAWDGPSDWNNYGSCPPNQCTYYDTNKGNVTVYSGQYDAFWWQDGGNYSTYCTEFCYCPDSGDVVCATGWDNIMADEGLKNAFIRDCGGSHSSGAVKYFV